MALIPIIFLFLAGRASAALEDGLKLLKDKRYEQAISALEVEAKGKQASAEVLLNLGWAYWRARRPDEAQKRWQELVRRFPAHPTYLRLLASLEIDRKDYEQAEIHARQAQKLAPADREASLVLARALLGRGKSDEAARLLETMIRNQPEKDPGRAGLAELMAKVGRPEEALQALDGLLHEDPGNAAYRRRRGQILYELGRVDEAIEEWKYLAEQKPPDPESMSELAWGYLRAKKTEEAARWVHLLRRLDPSNATFLRLEASLELEKKNFDRAVELARRAVELEPQEAENTLALARALLGQDKVSEAQALLEKLMQADPDSTAARFEMTDILARTGRVDEALSSLNELLQAEPGNASYRRRRAMLLYDAGRADEAVAEWKILSAESPEDLGIKLQLGWVSLRAKHLDEALSLGQELVEAQPKSGIYLRFLSEVQIERREFAEAIRLASEALKLDPNDLDATISLARALTDLRRERDALRVLESVERSGRSNNLIRLQMAGILSYLGRHQEAIALYNKLYEADPENLAWRRQRAEALYQSGDFKEAVAEWTKMARQIPPDARALRRLAEDAYNRNDWKEFLSWIGELSVVEDLDPVMWSMVSTAYSKLGDSLRAQDAADRYVERSPTSLEGYLFKAEILEAAKEWNGAKRLYEYSLTRNPHNRRAWDALARIAAEQGDYKECLRIQRAYVSGDAHEEANPYLKLREARWIAENGDTGGAMRIIKDLSKERKPSFAALLYHGVSRIERSDVLSARAFREQMQALKKAGWQSITVQDVDAFYKGKKPLPEKAVLITFDDARIDALQNADPILKDVGYKATMFVHLSALDRFPFHAGVDELRRWAATGRWIMQSHSAQGHIGINVDPAGRQGRFLANRLWLPDQYRLETEQEFRARLDKDYAEAKANMASQFPETPMLGYAFPFGEMGQMGAVNDPKALVINREILLKHFNYGFVQDPYGYNTLDSKKSELSRFEVPKAMTAQELVDQLSIQEPWAQAKLLEARVRLWMNQPGASLSAIAALEKRGVEGSVLLAEKGQAMERAGRGGEAEELYAQAVRREPAEPRYRDMEKESSIRNAPTLTSGFDSFVDNATRRNTKARLGISAPIRRLQLSGGLGRETYAEAGVPRIDANAGNFDAVWAPMAQTRVRGSLTRRQSDAPGDMDTVAGGLSVGLGRARISVDGEKGLLQTAAAIQGNIKRTVRAVSLGWEQDKTSLLLSGDGIKYTDGNAQKDFRFEATQYLKTWLGLGYAFWWGDSNEAKTAYWTPLDLIQHMVTLSLRGSLGSVSGNLRYGRGYGSQRQSSRWVESALVSVDWRVTDRISIIPELDYNKTPSYISGEARVGMSLRF